MTYTGKTFQGENGKFTAVRYKRDGAWVPGVWDRQTNKRAYGKSCSTSGGAVDIAARKAELLRQDGPRRNLTLQRHDPRVLSTPLARSDGDHSAAAAMQSLMPS